MARVVGGALIDRNDRSQPSRSRTRPQVRCPAANPQPENGCTHRGRQRFQAPGIDAGHDPRRDESPRTRRLDTAGTCRGGAFWAGSGTASRTATTSARRASGSARMLCRRSAATACAVDREPARGKPMSRGSLRTASMTVCISPIPSTRQCEATRPTAVEPSSNRAQAAPPRTPLRVGETCERSSTQPVSCPWPRSFGELERCGRPYDQTHRCRPNGSGDGSTRRPSRP